MIYSAADQVVCTVSRSSHAETFAAILTGAGYDGPETLDVYMNTVGKTISNPNIPGVTVNYPGAGKTVTVNKTSNDKTVAGVQAIGALIKATTGNNYLRIKIEAPNIRDFNQTNLAAGNAGRGDHIGNSITWLESAYYALQ